MNAKKIGLFIQTLRKEKKITQEELAQKLFVDRATVSKWETGNYIPSPEILLKLSKLFEVSVNELLAGEKSTKENKEHINEVPIQILKEARKKTKKIIFTSVSIFLLVILLLSLYSILVVYLPLKKYLKKDVIALLFNF